MKARILLVLLVLTWVFSCESKDIEIVYLEKDKIQKRANTKEEGLAIKRIKGAGTIRFGMDPLELPWCSKDKNTGEYIGYEVELNRLLTKKIASILNTPLKMEIIPGNWDSLPNDLKAMKFDVIGNAWTPSEEINSFVGWSIPNLEWGLMTLVRSESEAKSYKDLLKNKIGRYDDPSTKSFFEKLGFKDTLVYGDGNVAIEKLIDKTIDAYIYDSVFVKYQAQNNPKIKVIGSLLNQATYNYGVRKTEKDLLDIINRALVEVKKSSEYNSILEKWFGSH